MEESLSSLDAILEKISKEAGISKDEVKKLIEEKVDELSGLVSSEGAAYIVGRELGVSLLKEAKRQLKIKNIVSGLRSVDLVARVVKIFEPREFEREGKKGRVVNILLGDETGVVRLSLWNEEIEETNLREDETVQIIGGYVKEDNRRNPELRIGKGKLEKTDEKVELPDIQEMKQDFTVVKRKNIADFKEGGFEEARVCLVQVFRRNPFYEVCPQCGSRLTISEEKWMCTEHGEVQPEYQLVLSGVIDDGYGNIRSVFFREVAEKIFGKNIKELREIAAKSGDKMMIYDHFNNLGKDFIFRGRVRRNELTGNMEFIVNEIDDIDVKKEIDNLLGEIEEGKENKT